MEEDYSIVYAKKRKITNGQDHFKSKLDSYLEKIPDEPRLSRLVSRVLSRITAKQSKSLLAWSQDT